MGYIMTTKDFKIWLITNDYTIKTLSVALGITEKTIYNYQSTRFPKLFKLALYRDWETLWYRDWETDRKSTRLNSSHSAKSRMPSSA